ncbi:MAG: DUF933 domain-containing protein [Deltaproteobacteria bacterium]|nr:DUF933 domain-containing protein [Deltaproteobacteria bacterium]
MKVGLIGLPFSGKTTLFRALTGFGADAPAADVGVVKVPDARVAHLTEIFKPKKTTFAEITFSDLLAASHGGKAFDAQVIAAMKAMDALVIVVDGREGEDDAARDDRARRALDDMIVELVLSDLAIAEKRVERLKKEKTTEADRRVIEKALATLSEEKPLRGEAFDRDELRALSGYQFLTQKPTLVVVNTREGDPGKAFPRTEESAGKLSMPVIPLCAALEQEISTLPPEERGDFLKEMGLAEAAQDRLVRAVYEHLNLISFLTVGEDEVRAWTITRGTTAQKAGGKVHSDIERGFIRAEVAAYDDFVAGGSSMAGAKKAGRLRLEGKEYVIQDGDIAHFRFNV